MDDVRVGFPGVDEVDDALQRRHRLPRDPTTGLDPQARAGLWEEVASLRSAGTTVFLTTHYLEEAETLCGRIAMLKAGRIVALDTTANLLQRFACRALTVKLAAPVVLPPMLASRASKQDGVELAFGFDRFDEVADILAGIKSAGGAIVDMALGTPDMEQVFVGIMNQN